MILMTSHSVIISVSDSRGRGFKAYVDQNKLINKDSRIIEKAIGGADIDRLFREIRQITRSINKEYPTHRVIVILQGGICSLTTKETRRGHEEITYTSSKDKVKSVKETIQEITKYCEERGYYLIISTILPVSLLKAETFFKDRRRLRESRLTPQEKDAQQQALDADVTDINDYIKKTTKNCINSTSVNITKCYERRSLKKKGKKRAAKLIVKFDFSFMGDGVHINTEDKHSAFNKITKALAFLTQSSKKPESDSQDTQSEDEHNWDFKRQKH